MLNRNPTWDLQKHIIDGSTGPQSGDPVIRQYDAELDRDDPMQSITAGVGSGNFKGNDAATIQRINMTQALGMDTGDGKLGQEAISMSAANDWSDEPSKATDIAYGPSNTDSQRDSQRGGY